MLKTNSDAEVWYWNTSEFVFKLRHFVMAADLTYDPKASASNELLGALKFNMTSL